jgi:hypothetical protein
MGVQGRHARLLHVWYPLDGILGQGVVKLMVDVFTAATHWGTWRSCTLSQSQNKEWFATQATLHPTNSSQLKLLSLKD